MTRRWFGVAVLIVSGIATWGCGGGSQKPNRGADGSSLAGYPERGVAGEAGISGGGPGGKGGATAGASGSGGTAGASGSGGTAGASGTGGTAGASGSGGAGGPSGGASGAGGGAGLGGRGGGTAAAGGACSGSGFPANAPFECLGPPPLQGTCGECLEALAGGETVCNCLLGKAKTDCQALLTCLAPTFFGCPVNSGGQAAPRCYCSDATCSNGADGPCAAAFNVVAGRSDPAVVLQQLMVPSTISRVMEEGRRFGYTLACGRYCFCPS
jgi:hypothetical protein